jgi:hypothetical protein
MLVGFAIMNPRTSSHQLWNTFVKLSAPKNIQTYAFCSQFYARCHGNCSGEWRPSGGRSGPYLSAHTPILIRTKLILSVAYDHIDDVSAAQHFRNSFPGACYCPPILTCMFNPRKWRKWGAILHFTQSTSSYSVYSRPFLILNSTA